MVRKPFGPGRLFVFTVNATTPTTEYYCVKRLRTSCVITNTARSLSDDYVIPDVYYLRSVESLITFFSDWDNVYIVQSVFDDEISDYGYVLGFGLALDSTRIKIRQNMLSSLGCHKLNNSVGYKKKHKINATLEIEFVSLFLIKIRLHGLVSLARRW